MSAFVGSGSKGPARIIRVLRHTPTWCGVPHAGRSYYRCAACRKARAAFWRAIRQGVPFRPKGAALRPAVTELSLYPFASACLCRHQPCTCRCAECGYRLGALRLCSCAACCACCIQRSHGVGCCFWPRRPAGARRARPLSAGTGYEAFADNPPRLQHDTREDPDYGASNEWERPS